MFEFIMIYMYTHIVVYVLEQLLVFSIIPSLIQGNESPILAAQRELQEDHDHRKGVWGRRDQGKTVGKVGKPWDKMQEVRLFMCFVR